MDFAGRVPESTIRNRALALGISTSFLSRGLAALVPLLVVPVGLEYLGATGYGAWATALALSAFVAFADLGVGTGLMTRLGHVSDSPETSPEAREIVSSAYLMMAGVSLLGLGLLWGTAPWVDWAGLLDAPAGPAGASVEPIVLATLSAFFVNMFASLIVRVQYGLAQMGRSNLWQAAGSLSALAATLVAVRLDPGAGWFVAAATFAPVIVAFLNAGVFFGATGLGRAVAPKLSAFRPRVLMGLLALGGRFLVIAILMALAVAMDPWIVALTATLADVPSYSIPFRVFALIGTVSLMLTIPLWPLHARAVSSGDVAWIRRITTKMTIATPATIAGLSALAILVAPVVLPIWLGDQVTFNSRLWVGLAVWWVVQSATGPVFMVQNGAEVLWPQTVGYALFLLALPLKWWVSSRFGFEWMPYVSAVLYICVIWPVAWIGYRQSVTKAARSHGGLRLEQAL